MLKASKKGKLSYVWGVVHRKGCETYQFKHFLSRFQWCVHSILKTFLFYFHPGCRQSATFISKYTVFILGFWYDGSICHLIKTTSLFSVWKYWRSTDRQLSTGPLLPRDCFSHPVLAKGWIVMEKEQRGGEGGGGSHFTWSRHRNG